MTAEILLFLPSIARFRLVYLEQLIESAALWQPSALDATPDNMVTEEVKRSLLNHARVDAVILVEPNKPRRALLNITPREDMPRFNLKERGALGLIWDALTAMSRDGAYYTRVGGESMRLPKAMVWIVVDELPIADRHVWLYRPCAGAFRHHCAVHRGVALPGATLAGDPTAAGPLGRHGGLSGARPRSRTPSVRRPAATTRSAWSTANSRTCSASSAPRCARRAAWPRSAPLPTRSTTTCATSCRRHGCCPTGWRAADDERTRKLAPHHSQHHRSRDAAGERRHPICPRPPDAAARRVRPLRPGRRGGRGTAGAGRGRRSECAAQLGE